jgi:hypothetical protein
MVAMTQFLFNTFFARRTFTGRPEVNEISTETRGLVTVHHFV